MVGEIVVELDLKAKHEWQQYVSNGTLPIIIELLVKLSQ